MCECLEYAEGDMYLCPPCADEYRNTKEKYEALGTLFAEFVQKVDDTARERNDDELKTLAKEYLDKVVEVLGLDLDWECIFDVDRPISEWKLQENTDLLKTNEEQDYGLS